MLVPGSAQVGHRVLALAEGLLVGQVVLEAVGGDGVEQSLEAMSTPPTWPALLRGPACWGDFTVEQAGTGTSVLLPRGRGLGGSSSINAMIFARGHRSSYDAWQVAGWSFDDLLPYFKRTEHAPGRDPALRGVGGPLTVAPADPVNPVLVACLEAALEAGHSRASDVSGGLEERFGPVDLNIVGGRRQSGADAYLAPALGRPNLRVVTGALVHRLRIAGGRCTGVDYSAGGRREFAVCSGEVMPAAGTIGSAQLLMRSGIGPSAHLREHGIDVVADLPGVGENLHDHPVANVVYRSARPIPPGTHNHAEAFGLVRSDPVLDAPDLQLLFIDGPGHVPDAGAGEGYTIGVALMRPFSRGTVRLGSPVPGAPPVLDPGYYSDDRDLAIVVRGLRMAHRIGDARALDSWRDQEMTPRTATLDDDGLRAYARAVLASYCHPVGTCRLGDDDLAVVDRDLRVHGLRGLRVADASVIPAIPSANTNATVYAIAERAAELVTTLVPGA
ncbi:GMC family oxidoreductase [Nonomuraea terrae]|uniref:GMC family oxidoreductase n=1 Tax=Nonomuraea terrae TaxID=2530383 RepID=UPI0037B30617